ncbi:hypothetical protein FHG64_18965 [Antarcticibacterium flavum]|uniref:VanZ-like domain-containing protein n=1 Tax=Antarcticibacterium flavum TaxID=2058175 RepID=A0A5B7WXM0_9FLAO|nr:MULTISPECIES: hypothetical protein [Antarcticibacterium]MCM4160314.1 hypothetical protein [Antarcticibacterium sp. W02-3]QCY67914.1 hypothetical protein FHG64_00050 [Antarcticibacterium flavum]QCY71307.1 hypothetical protein FHG64_18965 [Antarcticibacterium flavum]
MKKHHLLLIVLIVILFYPVISAFQAGDVLGTLTDAGRVERSISLYHLSIWLSWLVFVSVAIFHKWTTQANQFFYFTYIFLFVAYIIYGYFLQEFVNRFELPTTFRDNYSFGVLTAIINFAGAAALTGILQAGVWWFTRRWHRR